VEESGREEKRGEEVRGEIRERGKGREGKEGGWCPPPT